MEDEKKKKKNKKKKNKQQQNKAAGESVAADSGDVNAQATHSRDAETERHLANGAQALSEAEKQYWLDREATLQEKIKQFEKEKNVQKEKETILEGKVEHLLKDREIIIQKEATLEGNIVQLQKEKDAQMNKEAGLEERVRKLQKEKDSLLLKEAEQETKIMHFESEKRTWLQKENSCEEKIASMDGENRELQSKVVQLEELRDNLVEETRDLRECISGLQSQIQNLEKSTPIPSSSTIRHTETCENGEINSETDAANMLLVQKLMSENAELVEKVNELYVELDRRGEAYPDGYAAGVAEPLLGTSKKKMSWQEEMMESVEEVAKKEEMSIGMRRRSEITEASDDEIVEIPEVEVDVKSVIERTGSDKEEEKEVVVVETGEVPLTDAPLIGAPFRLISFVARYVSGADLVNHNNNDTY